MTKDDRASTEDAAGTLTVLASDRERLVDGVRAPRALLAALGGVGASLAATATTSTPGGNFELPWSVWLVLAVALVIAHLIRREMGLRFRTAGASAAGAGVGILVGCLALFALSLGLVSVDLRFAVVLTSAAAFVLTMCLAGVAYRTGAERLRRSGREPAEACFDELIRSPLQLRICGVLRPVAEVDVAVLRDALTVSDAVLSGELRALFDAGYVSSTKATRGLGGDARWPTSLSLTFAGMYAFDRHVLALQEMATARD